MDLPRLAAKSGQSPEAVLGAVARGLARGRELPPELPWPEPEGAGLDVLVKAAAGQPPEALGQVYEALLARDQPARRRRGCHYTPPDLAAKVVAGALAPLGSSPPRVLDPAMGAGVFLIQSCRLLARRHNLTLAAAAAYLYGIDIDPLAVMVARASLWLLTDIWPAGLCCGDALLEFPWDQFDPGLRRSGFDAVVGNPPFLGGSFITGALGREYRDRLVVEVAEGRRGNADLCAYFLLRAHELVRPAGAVGLICTNTIAEGATGQVGLARLLARGARVYAAEPDLPWPGEASLHVSLVWLRRAGPGSDRPAARLNGRAVAVIDAGLRGGPSLPARPARLPENLGRAFNGSKIYGQGFVLSEPEAAALLEREPEAAEVLRPYLSGDDLYGRADRQPSRQVICFTGWSLAQAARLPVCLERVRLRVKPERDRLRGRNSIGDRRAAVWWQFGSPAPALYAALEGRRRVLAKVLHSHTHAFVPVPADYVFSHALAIIADDHPALLAALHSSLHEHWAVAHGSSLGRAPRYTLSRTFETFPLPPRTAELGRLGEELEEHRLRMAAARGEGLTALHARLHNPADKAADVEALRMLLQAIDDAVLRAYGWDDASLRQGFHATPYGPRFGPEPGSAELVQARLRALNQERLGGPTSRQP